MTKQTLVALTLGVATLSAGVASAAPITWNLASSSCTGSGSTDGNSRTCSGGSGAPSVTATAWSNTANGANVNIENALLQVFSGGLGVRNRDRGTGLGDTGENSTPQHAIDNENRYDSILLSFNGLVALNQVRLGYWSGDSDITVLAYLGAGTPTLAGSSYGALTAANWSLIGHYGNLNYTAAINAGNLASQYWLVSTYNPTVGQAANFSTGDDHVKLYSVSGESQPVPEPASLALIGSGLFFGAAVRRRARRS
ncbi:MAG: exosortase-dependent surface protein XDP1 [Vicinamibacterales bacterium]